jgi:hypothetical protein
MGTRADAVNRADTAGLMDWQLLRAEAKRGSAELFAEAYPFPALLLLAPETELREVKDDTNLFQIRTIAGRSGGAAAFHQRVAFLAKRPGNPFLQMITIGRASNNDVVIELPTISKFHAYIESTGGAWRLSPQRSVNGTRVNGVPIDADAKKPLADLDLIHLGQDLEAVFLLPKTLHSRLLMAP